jgi:hypothetical protein
MNRTAPQPGGPSTSASAELVPHAVIALCPADIEDISPLRFEQQVDDLDYLAAAAGTFDGLHFRLRQYRGHPANETTLMLPVSAQPDAVDRIIVALRIPPTAVTWRRTPSTEL